MRRRRGGQLSKRAGDAGDLLGQKIEFDGLDGDEAIALLIPRTKHGSENAASSLMEDAKRAEGRRCAGPGGVVEWQIKQENIRKFVSKGTLPLVD